MQTKKRLDVIFKVDTFVMFPESSQTRFFPRTQNFNQNFFNDEVKIESKCALSGCAC